MCKAKVVAVVSTYRRAVELDRLVKSLLGGSVPIWGLVVNDDAADPATMEVIKRVEVPSEFLVRRPSPENSAASGWNRGLEAARRRFGNEATHYLLIDDDAMVEEATLEGLLVAQREAGVGSSFPAALNPEGKFYITSQLHSREDTDAMKRCMVKEDLIREFGATCPRAWMFQGLCHLMRRDVVDSGVRVDERFWMCGEDLDFSVRVAEKWGSVFVPAAFCWHLYGAPFNPRSAKNSDYLKRLSFIQNITYIAYWREYGNRIRGRRLDFLRGRGIGPTYANFFKDFGWSLNTVFDLAWVICFGMLLGQPSNLWAGRNLRRRRMNYLVN
jgi:GT2 family glycosyltransferase